MHRKDCAFLKEDNPSDVLQERDLESLKNKMNIDNKYKKHVKTSASGINTEEEFHKIAADNNRDALVILSPSLIVSRLLSNCQSPIQW
jgi:hypothetical protein